MGKLILFLLIAVAIYWWLRRPGKTLGRKSSAEASETETMVRCHHCGLHIPLPESLTANGHHYCCDEHRSLDTGGTRD